MIVWVCGLYSRLYAGDQPQLEALSWLFQDVQAHRLPTSCIPNSRPFVLDYIVAVPNILYSITVFASCGWLFLPTGSLTHGAA